MKKIIINLILAAACVMPVLAQTTGQVSTLTTTSFEVNGLKVIFKPTVKEVISVRMYYRGGNTNYLPEQAGIENFALKAATECGVKKYTANTFKDMADNYNINIGGSSSYDYGNISLNCVAKYFDLGWDLFSRAVTEPAFETSEVELLKAKLLAAIGGSATNPDDRIEKLALQNAFGNTPYAYDPDGTEVSINALNADALKAYYYKLLNKKRMFLVVAGKITREQLEQKVKAAFAGLPEPSYQPATYTTPEWEGQKVLAEKRDIATNYLNAVMNAPLMSSPDFVPFRMGINGLSGILFSQLRTKYNLSYAPGAYTVMQQMPYAMMYVSTTNPKEAAKIMLECVERIKNSTLTPSGLRDMKSGYITSNYMKQQSSDAVTGNLGTAEIMGDYMYAERMPDLINGVTPAQINLALNKYIKGFRWSYLGTEKDAEGLLQN